MYTLAFHITADGKFNPELDAKDHAQAKPLKIEVALLDENFNKCGGAEWVVRPEGWEPASNRLGNVWEYGLALKNILAPITAKGGAVGTAKALLCHNFEEQDGLMRICRRLCEYKEEWLRDPPIKPLDTASLVPHAVSGELDMSVPVPPTLKEATLQVFGKEIEGLEGVLSLYERLKEKEAA